VLRRFLLGLGAQSGTHHVEWRRLATAETIAGIASRGLAEVLAHDPLARYRRELMAAEGELLDRCLLADQGVYLPSDMLVKVDRMSMAHGLEIRVPFLDRRVMEFAGRLDHRLLAAPTGPGKRVLRRAVAALGAPAAMVKGVKRGFNVPLAKLLRTELKGVGDELLLRQPDLFAPMLDPVALRRLWQAHVTGQQNHAYLLWALLVFGSWRQQGH